MTKKKETHKIKRLLIILFVFFFVVIIIYFIGGFERDPEFEIKEKQCHNETIEEGYSIWENFEVLNYSCRYLNEFKISKLKTDYLYCVEITGFRNCKEIKSKIELLIKEDEEYLIRCKEAERKRDLEKQKEEGERAKNRTREVCEQVEVDVIEYAPYFSCTDNETYFDEEKIVYTYNSSASGNYGINYCITEYNKKSKEDLSIDWLDKNAECIKYESEDEDKRIKWANKCSRKYHIKEGIEDYTTCFHEKYIDGWIDECEDGYCKNICQEYKYEGYEIRVK